MGSTMLEAFEAVIDTTALEPMNPHLGRYYPPSLRSTGSTNEVRELIDAVALRLRPQCRSRDLIDEALANALGALAEQQHRCFSEFPREWTGLLTYFGERSLRDLLAKRHRQRLILEEEAGMEMVSLDSLPADDMETLNPRPIEQLGGHLGPAIGAAERTAVRYWTDAEIVGAIQRWTEEKGRAPAGSDFNGRNGLPSPITVRRHFGSQGAALKAAGLQPGRRAARPTWGKLEAANACQDFFDRERVWPGNAELSIKRSLPTVHAAKRFFGGTSRRAVAAGTQRILAEAA